MQIIKQKCPLFSGLDEVDFSAMSQKFVLLNYKKNDAVFSSEDVNKNLYVIEGGVVKIECAHEGRKFITAFLTTGDHFGHTGLFSNGKARASAICKTDCKIYKLKQEDIDLFILNYPIFVYNLLSGFANHVSFSHKTIHALAFMPVKKRLLRALLHLSTFFKEASGEAFIPLSQEEFSNYIGSARENIARMLAELKKEGIVDMKTKDIEIVNPKKIKNLLGIT